MHNCFELSRTDTPDYDNLINKVKGITPVPGGVGPMTITMLLNNTVSSAEKTII